MDMLVEYSEQFLTLIGSVFTTLSSTYGILTTSIIAILTLFGLYFLLKTCLGWFKKGWNKLFKREVRLVNQTHY